MTDAAVISFPHFLSFLSGATQGATIYVLPAEVAKHDDALDLCFRPTSVFYYICRNSTMLQ